MKTYFLFAALLAAFAPLVYSQELEVDSWSWGRSSSAYLKAEGVVKNVSENAFKNLEVVLMTYDSKGQFISSEKSLIEFRPLLPNQTSPWSVLIKARPEIAKASISFKPYGGTAIPHKEIQK